MIGSVIMKIIITITAIMGIFKSEGQKVGYTKIATNTEKRGQCKFQTKILCWSFQERFELRTIFHCLKKIDGKLDGTEEILKKEELSWQNNWKVTKKSKN